MSRVNRLWGKADFSPQFAAPAGSRPEAEANYNGQRPATCPVVCGFLCREISKNPIGRARSFVQGNGAFTVGRRAMQGLRSWVRRIARGWTAGRQAAPASLAAGLDLIFNGVQTLPGRPDQWVFTDRITGGTFYTGVGISPAALRRATNARRAGFVSS